MIPPRHARAPWHVSPRLALPLAAALLAACDSPASITDQAVYEQAVVRIVEESFTVLVTGGEVELLTLTELKRAPDGEEGAEAAREILFDAGALAAEWSSAVWTTGGWEEAQIVRRAMTDWMTESWMEAAAAIFGPGLAADVLAGVEGVLDRIDDELEGGFPSPLVAQGLFRARAKAEEAKLAASEGRPVEALVLGTEAAEQVEELSPQRRAEWAVMRARLMLEHGDALAGGSPAEAVWEDLDRTRGECMSAELWLEEERWANATDQALSCRWGARHVLVALAGGFTEGRLSGRTAALVQRAEELRERAVTASGDVPDPDIAPVLEEAARRFVAAADALGTGSWRDAVWLARESGSLSMRVLMALRDALESEGLESRALVLVEYAEYLAESTEQALGFEPDPLLREGADRAGELIEAARGALLAGDWRRAMLRASRATDLLAGVRLALR